MSSQGAASKRSRHQPRHLSHNFDHEEPSVEALFEDVSAVLRIQTQLVAIVSALNRQPPAAHGPKCSIHSGAGGRVLFKMRLIRLQKAVLDLREQQHHQQHHEQLQRQHQHQQPCQHQEHTGTRPGTGSSSSVDTAGRVVPLTLPSVEKVLVELRRAQVFRFDHSVFEEFEPRDFQNPPPQSTPTHKTPQDSAENKDGSKTPSMARAARAYLHQIQHLLRCPSAARRRTLLHGTEGLLAMGLDLIHIVLDAEKEAEQSAGRRTACNAGIGSLRQSARTSELVAMMRSFLGCLFKRAPPSHQARGAVHNLVPEDELFYGKCGYLAALLRAWKAVTRIQTITRSEASSSSSLSSSSSSSSSSSLPLNAGKSDDLNPRDDCSSSGPPATGGCNFDAERQRLAELCYRTYCDVLDRGFLSGRVRDFEANFRWHGACYLGAAHGIAGILYILDAFWEWHSTLSVGPRADVSVARAFNAMDMPNRAFRGVALGRPVLPRSALSTFALRVAREYAFEGGNMPSSVKPSMRDRLVQFCHGASGWLLLGCRLGWENGNAEPSVNAAAKAAEAGEAAAAAAAAAAKNHPSSAEGASKNCIVSEKNSAAVDCWSHRIVRLADVVWKRGILPSKGLGLCHSTAGNGYALLVLWKTTQEPKFLHRAFRFALYLCSPSEGEPQEMVWAQSVPNADHPWSLYEGALGAASFLLDCLLARDVELHRRRHSRHESEGTTATAANALVHHHGLLELISFPGLE